MWASKGKKKRSSKKVNDLNHKFQKEMKIKQKRVHFANKIMIEVITYIHLFMMYDEQWNMLLVETLMYFPIELSSNWWSLLREVVEVEVDGA